MAFLIYDTEALAARVRDLRAKAEGYPQPGSVRGSDYFREPLGSRFAMEFDEAWGESFLPTFNGVQLLAPEELDEIQGLLADLVPELPPDWQYEPEPDEDP